MPNEKGGRADKLGNKYENWWLVKQMLRLVEEEISSLIVEAIGDEEIGVDLWINNKNGSKECHQCKGRNASNEYWRIGDLAAKGIFIKAKQQLDSDNNVYYHFVSPLTNTMLKDISIRARNSNDSEAFYKHQILSSQDKSKPQNNQQIEKCFVSFCEYMELSNDIKENREIAYNYLKRMHFILFSDDINVKLSLLKDIKHLFIGDPNTIFNLLASYPIENDALGHTITANILITYLESVDDIFLRRLNNDDKILTRIKILNEEFLYSFTPINNLFIHRSAANECYSEIIDGYSYIFHGSAGCGKSGIAYQLASMLKDNGIAYLALKLDRRIPVDSAEHYGKSLGLPASPTFCLDSIAAENEAVLILDQLDAVRWTSAHSSTALDVCKEIIDEIVQLNKTRKKKVSIVVVCRTFDFKNDRGIRMLFEQKTGIIQESIVWHNKVITELGDEDVKLIIGNTYSSFPPKLKSLLRNPNNLYIWTNIEIKDTMSTIKSTGDLVSAWWSELREKYGINGMDVNQLTIIKDKLVNLINKSGRLFVSDILLNDCAPNSRKYLLSSGMIILEESKIGFVHQSFYDFFSMEKMLNKLYDGHSILNIIEAKENQTPLRRYHLQMLLENILIADVDKFIEIGKALLESTETRFIMKHAYLAVLGQTKLPQQQLYTFVYSLYNDAYWKPHILDTIFYGNAQFVKALIEDGRISEWISSKNECDTALNLLRSVNTSLQEEITSILVKFAFVVDEMDEKLYNVLCRDVADDSDSMFEIRLKMIKHNNSNMQRYLNWDSLTKRNPKRALELFKLLVFEKNSISNWNNHYINQENINRLNYTAQADAKQIWKEFMPFLLEQTSGISHRYDAEFRFWETKQYPDQVFGRIFIGLIKAAATTLILENSEFFLVLSNPYFECDSVVINEILLFIMNELPAQHSDFVVSWLSKNTQKRFFEYTSENDEYLFLAKSAIEKHSKTCSKEIFVQLETAIYLFHEENELQMAKWRFQDNHNSRQAGINKMYFYPYWGKVQNYLLPSLDEGRISKYTKDLIGVLKRRFADVPPSHVRSKVTCGVVGSTIGAVADKISDKQWLRILQNKKSINCFREHYSDSGNILESSPEQFAQTLENLGDKDPNRVANLALQFDENTDIHYITTIFRIIGKTKPSDQNSDIIDWRPVEKNIAEQLLLKFGKLTDAATEYSRAIGNRAKEEWCDDMLARLSEITKSHPNPELGKMNVVSSSGKDSETVNSLFTDSVNCTRGCAARAVASLLWENYSRYSILKDAVESAVFDEHLAVNMAAVECILPICNFDKDAAKNWFSLLVTKDIRIAAHPLARSIYYNIYKKHEGFVIRTVLKMYYSEYDDVSETGAKYITNLYLLYGCFEEIIFCEAQKTTVQIKGILYISIELLKYPQHYEKAKKIIEYHLDYVDEESSIMLPRILDYGTISVDYDSDFIIKVVSSKQSRLMMNHFIDFIEESDVPLVAFSDIIFAICDSLVKYEKSEVNDPSYDYYDEASSLSKLITFLYEQSKDRPELLDINQQCLNMWDLMFEHRIGTIRDLSQSIMEQ